MFRQQLSIRRRILYLFVTLGILLFVVNIIRLLTQRAAFEQLADVTLEQPLAVSLLSQMAESIGRMREEALSAAFLLSNNLRLEDVEVHEEIEEHDAADAEMTRLIEQFRATANQPEDLVLADALDRFLQQAHRHTHQLIERAALAAQDDSSQAALLDDAELLEADEAIIDQLITREIGERLRTVEASRAEIASYEARTNLTQITEAVALFVVLLLLWLWLDGTAFKPLRQLTHAAVRMGSGDFSQRIEVRQGGEIATLAREFNQMAQNIQLMLEEEADLTKVAEQASAFKTNLIARISHELRSPLGAISGMTEMLQFGAYGPLNPGQTEISDRILENAAQLSKLVNELLAQSRLEAHSAQQLHLDIVDPQLVVERIARMHESAAIRKAIGLEIALEKGMPRRVVTDVSRLEQIINNLVGNAVKFTERGHVTVTAAPYGEDDWRLTVKDTGIGIKPEDRAHIFEPFRQGEQSITRRYGGVGLGLALVKAYVEQLGGSLAFESAVGSGSTFMVTLPTASRAIAAEETAEAPKTQLNAAAV